MCRPAAAVRWGAQETPDLGKEELAFAKVQDDADQAGATNFVSSLELLYRCGRLAAACVALVRQATHRRSDTLFVMCVCRCVGVSVSVSVSVCVPAWPPPHTFAEQSAPSRCPRTPLLASRRMLHCRWMHSACLQACCSERRGMPCQRCGPSERLGCWCADSTRLAPSATYVRRVWVPCCSSGLQAHLL